MATHFFVPKYNEKFGLININTGFLADVITYFADLKLGFEKRAAEKRTYRELQALSSRELGDIGLSRSDIMAVSKGIFKN